MSVIHRTTMTPSKLELLADWLPSQIWYVGGEREPELAKAGGFRLDDPDGEVGIEFMVVADACGDRPVSYLLPLTYRGTPLDGADHALLGTAEHGVLGRRWVYDGVHDPVLVAQLLALLQGRAEPQDQNRTGTPDPGVVAHFAEGEVRAMAAPKAVMDGSHSTDIVMTTTTEPGRTEDSTDTATLTVVRALNPRALKGRSHITATWHLPDGTEHRGTFAALDAFGAGER